MICIRNGRYLIIALLIIIPSISDAPMKFSAMNAAYIDVTCKYMQNKLSYYKSIG